MKFLLLLLIPIFSFSQVGIGTTSPKGQLDVHSNTMGLVIPRVTKVEDVTDGSSNLAVDGTVVYDVSRNKTCFRIASQWACISDTEDEVITDPFDKSIYIKASNTGANDQFGYSVSLSADGSTLAVGAPYEDKDTGQTNAGAVYVFKRNNAGVWSQEAFIQASNYGALDFFGFSVSLSADGFTLAVGAFKEDTSAADSGAAYIFKKTGSTWSQDALIKADTPENDDSFGISVSLNEDGSVLAVGAHHEDSADGTDQNNNGVSDSGAAYVFKKTGSAWSQEAYIKASNIGISDSFGKSVALSPNGSTLAVAAYLEDSNATGVDGDQNNNGAADSGAVYIFTNCSNTWSQDAYVKASNTGGGDFFGVSVSLNFDGTTLAVGAEREDTSGSDSGAAYVFKKTGSTWSQEAFLKASNVGNIDYFGHAISLSANGNTLAVSAYYEDSNATGLDGVEGDNSATNSGAVYVFKRSASTWSPDTYVKASNTEEYDNFGWSTALSGNSLIMAVGARFEDSNATGIGGDQSNNGASNSGAVYIVE